MNILPHVHLKIFVEMTDDHEKSSDVFYIIFFVCLIFLFYNNLNQFMLATLGSLYEKGISRVVAIGITNERHLVIGFSIFFFSLDSFSILTHSLSLCFTL